MKFPKAFVLTSHDTDEKLVFEDIDDLKRFSESETSAWAEMLAAAVSQGSGLIRSSAEQAQRFLGVLREQVSTLERLFTPEDGAWESQQTRQVVSQIEHTLRQFADGVPWMVSSSNLGLKVAALGKLHPSRAIALWLIENDKNADALGSVGQGVGLQTLLRSIRYLDPEDIPRTTELPGVAELRSDYQAQLSLLKDRLSETEEELAAFFEKINQTQAGQKTSFENAEAGWVEKTEATFNGISSQWEKMQLTFNTQLALRAPTTYWKDQAKSSRRRLWASAVAFVVAGAISLWAFLRWGLPYLAAPGSPDRSIVLHILPILFPAFIVIWIMKILSKLMSGYLQRADDANERRVMVMTFLALMNKDDSGDTLVNDQDRILILHSLFRPSNVSPTDDAPPVHWFDLLTSRLQR